MKLFSYWKVMLALTVVVLCSSLMGAAVAARIHNQRLARLVRGGLADEAAAERLLKYLQLTSAQQDTIRPILERGQGEIRTIVTNAIAQTVQARKRLESEIRPLLTPEQQHRLEQMIERRERLWDRWKTVERMIPTSPATRERMQERTNKAPATSSPQ